MKLTIKYFAMLREAMGRDSEEVCVPPSVQTLAQLRQWLCQDDPVRAGAFAGVARIRCSCNCVMAPEQTALNEGDEVAFFPPVTGG